MKRKSADALADAEEDTSTRPRSRLGANGCCLWEGEDCCNEFTHRYVGCGDSWTSVATVLRITITYHTQLVTMEYLSVIIPVPTIIL